MYVVDIQISNLFQQLESLSIPNKNIYMFLWVTSDYPNYTAQKWETERGPGCRFPSQKTR